MVEMIGVSRLVKNKFSKGHRLGKANRKLLVNVAGSTNLDNLYMFDPPAM
jgi:hypothetical protein